MLYESPLHIIPKSFDFDGSAKQLKRLRKELLLRFDLSGSTTIDIDGKAFDRQSIIQHINALTEQSEFHLAIYQCPSLLAFLTHQELTFFKKKEDWQLIEEVTFQKQLQPYFTAAYSKKLKAILSKNVALPTAELTALLKNDFSLPYSYEADAYADSMGYLKQWIREINTAYSKSVKYVDEPDFTDIRALTKKLKPYFTPFYLTAFQSLPNHFDQLKYSYSNVAVDLVNFYNKKYYRLDRMGYQTIHLVKNFAAVIYKITGRYEEGYKQLKQHAANRVKPEERGKFALKVIAGIVIIYGCIFLYFAMLSYGSKQADRANTKLMIGHWKTEMKLLKMKEKAIRFVELKSDGTGQTQIVINPSEDYSCKLTAKFKWEVTGNFIKYKFDRLTTFIPIESSTRKIPIDRNVFSNSCDTLPADYQTFYRHLSSALSVDELGTVHKKYFYTATAGLTDDYFLVEMMRTQAGIKSQNFYFEKVDSSYKEEANLKELFKMNTRGIE